MRILVKHPGRSVRRWAQLDEFYRESNRRQIRNILRVMEAQGEHTWSSGIAPVPAVSTAELQQLTPLEQLRQLGFGGYLVCCRPPLPRIV